jgi:hypothetical protein
MGQMMRKRQKIKVKRSAGSKYLHRDRERGRHMVFGMMYRSVLRIRISLIFFRTRSAGV